MTCCLFQTDDGRMFIDSDQLGLLEMVDRPVSEAEKIGNALFRHWLQTRHAAWYYGPKETIDDLAMRHEFLDGYDEWKKRLSGAEIAGIYATQTTAQGCS